MFLFEIIFRMMLFSQNKCQERVADKMTQNLSNRSQIDGLHTICMTLCECKDKLFALSLRKLIVKYALGNCEQALSSLGFH